VNDASDDVENWGEDPGWRLDWRVLIVIMPGGLQWQARHTRAGDSLTMVRNLFVSFASSVVLFGVVLAFISVPQRGPAWAWVLPLLAIAAVALGVANALERPLDCSSDTTLAGSYRTRYFLRMAFTELVALAAFVMYFLDGPRWIYYLGAVISLARMISQAPTAAALVRDQDALVMQGCSRSLVAALRHPQG
jgi:F0F1-type ATP synthase membrane subunit c/vacuolar-type H+-ATPase subunit K